MGLLSDCVRYLQENPRTAVWGGIGLVALYVLLNWKSKRTRQAEEQLSRMLKDREDYYRQTRPPS
jgi:hypothetical protein